jgi:hypothetical protein
MTIQTIASVPQSPNTSCIIAVISFISIVFCAVFIICDSYDDEAVGIIAEER